MLGDGSNMKFDFDSSNGQQRQVWSVVRTRIDEGFFISGSFEDDWTEWDLRCFSEAAFSEVLEKFRTLSDNAKRKTKGRVTCIY